MRWTSVDTREAPKTKLHLLETINAQVSDTSTSLYVCMRIYVYIYTRTRYLTRLSTFKANVAELPFPRSFDVPSESVFLLSGRFRCLPKASIFVGNKEDRDGFFFFGVSKSGSLVGRRTRKTRG